MILIVIPIPKKKLEDRAIGVQRSKEHGDMKDIWSVFFVGDTMPKPFYM